MVKGEGREGAREGGGEGGQQSSRLRGGSKAVSEISRRDLDICDQSRCTWHRQRKQEADRYI